MMASPYPIQINFMALAQLSRAVRHNPHREPEAPPAYNNRIFDNPPPRGQPNQSALKPTQTPNASLLAALKKSKNKPLLSTSVPLPRIFHSQETLVDRDRFWGVDLEGQPAAAVLPTRSNDHEYKRIESEKAEANRQWLEKLREKKLRKMDRRVVLGFVMVLCFVGFLITAVVVLSRILGPW